MELFDIEGGKLVLNPANLYIPEIRALWERDKTKEKNQATKEISYVTFMGNMSTKNPYMAYSERDKEVKVRKDTIQKEPDEAIKKALERYKEFQNTTNTRLLLGARSAADKLAGYFEGVDFSQLDSYGKPVYSARELASNLKEVGNIVKSLVLLEKQVQKEQLDQQAVRGGNEIGQYELPDLDLEDDRSTEQEI